MGFRFRCVAVLVLVVVAAGLRAEEPAALWWSFQPIVRPQPPAGPQIRNTKHEIRNEIDRFILAKLKDKGLSSLARGRPPHAHPPRDLRPHRPAADARRSRGVRRRQVAGRLREARRSPARLAAYGERMARHWMDAVHFAETHGHDQDRVRPNAWRYRDYLIDAFNADTPYARFVQEQIAADVLFPDEPNSTPALGFLAAGPVGRELAPRHPRGHHRREVGRYLDRDDIVTTVFNTFQGLTVQCARCHDHKFDPIAQDEYYRLQAVFAGVGRGDVPFEADPAIAQEAEGIAGDAGGDRQDGRRGSTPRLDSPETRKAVAAWESAHAGAGRGVASARVHAASKRRKGPSSRSSPTARSVRRDRGRRRPPTRSSARVKSTAHHGGAAGTAHRRFAAAQGPRPAGQRQPAPERVRRLRPAAGERVKPKPLASPRSSDFDQAGLDHRPRHRRQPATAWGIYPQVGKPHEAVFELAEAAGGEASTELLVPAGTTARRRPPDRPVPAVGHDRPSTPVKAALVPPSDPRHPRDAAAKRTPEQARELAAPRASASKPTRSLPRCRRRSWSTPPRRTSLPDGSHKPARCRARSTC